MMRSFPREPLPRPKQATKMTRAPTDPVVGYELAGLDLTQNPEHRLEHTVRLTTVAAFPLPCYDVDLWLGELIGGHGLLLLGRDIC